MRQGTVITLLESVHALLDSMEQTAAIVSLTLHEVHNLRQQRELGMRLELSSTMFQCKCWLTLGF